MKYTKEQIALALLRIGLGWIFFWAFLDKLFGLGFNTPAGKAWLDGASPTLGFLKFATKGPLASVYQGMAGSILVDWLFMFGLLFVGITLILGIIIRLGSYTGILMLALMYTAGFLPPEHNPIIDEHIIYSIALVIIAGFDSGQFFGLGKWWANLNFIKEHKMLR